MPKCANLLALHSKNVGFPVQKFVIWPAGLALNGMLVFQCLYYGNKSPAAPKAGSKTSKIH